MSTPKEFWGFSFVYLTFYCKVTLIFLSLLFFLKELV